MSAITPAAPASPDMAGAICTACRSSDRRWEAVQHAPGESWHIYDHEGAGLMRAVQTYPDAPGMNALVALRRWLAEWETIKREKHGE